MSERPEPFHTLDEDVDRIEGIVRKTRYVSTIDQQVLRGYLSVVPRAETVIRDRLIALLNPRRAGVIYLSPEEFQHSYWITTEDNYQFHDNSPDDIFAMFDAEHGYYVAGLITVIE